jgi:hypothetical protein
MKNEGMKKKKKERKEEKRDEIETLSILQVCPQFISVDLQLEVEAEEV